MARLFVALGLPPELRDEMAAWQERFDPALRPVRAEGLHVTLAFLGHRDEGEVGAIAEAAFSEVDAPAPLLDLDPDPVAVPRGRRARLFALEAADGTAGGVEAVQRQVVKGLTAAGLFEPEERPFWTHVTVARVRSGKKPPTNIRSQRFHPTRLIALTLFRSHTKREGAVYEPMAALELPTAETER